MRTDLRPYGKKYQNKRRQLSHWTINSVSTSFAGFYRCNPFSLESRSSLKDLPSVQVHVTNGTSEVPNENTSFMLIMRLSTESSPFLYKTCESQRDLRQQLTIDNEMCHPIIPRTVHNLIWPSVPVKPNVMCIQSAPGCCLILLGKTTLLPQMEHENFPESPSILELNALCVLCDFRSLQATPLGNQRADRVMPQ